MLAALIRARGPLPVADFMALALGDPTQGYYQGRDPLGAAGDFTTAPEISQMFGEIVGLWLAEAWAQCGRPAPALLVELGPGRGTLMADLLRATARVEGFRRSLAVHLVEASPRLRALQADRLGGVDATWHERFEQVPAGPLFLVANEFFDALPSPPAGAHRAGLGRAPGRARRRTAASPSSRRTDPRRSAGRSRTPRRARSRRSARRAQSSRGRSANGSRQRAGSPC